MLSPTLIRRYTPPTCSLEIVAKTSALSQWTGNPVIKELRFELSLDDPRLTDEQKILLTGDRQQLEDLVEAVTDYVQNFLQQTNPVFDFAPTQNIFTYKTQGLGNVATIARPQLETKGLLSHRLHLGRLANEVSGQTIQLSATQLYDLANALESYSSDMVALPVLTATRNRKNVIRWGSIAASVLLVVGISKMAWQQQQMTESQQAIANLDQAVPENNAAQLVPPNPHLSYTITPIPPKEAPSLTATKAPQKTVNLEPPPPSPQPSSAPAPKSAPPPAERITSAPAQPAPAPIQPSLRGGVSATDSSFESSVADQAEQEAEEFLITAAPATTSQRTSSGDRREQAEAYFKSQWEAPTELNETLQYRITLDEAGTIQKVFPIGKAAELYQNKLTFLALDTAIATPSQIETVPLRLVLDPDGTVQVFPEQPKP